MDLNLINLDQIMYKNMLETTTWHFCMYCNTSNGRVVIKECLAYKIQLQGLD